jgi:cardiolipin synthase
MRFVPNAVTLLRIPMGAFAAVGVLRGWETLALLLFLLAALTDFLDGALARRLRAETRLGSRLEPLADSLYVVPMIFALDRRHHFLDLPTVAGLVALILVVGLILLRLNAGLMGWLHSLTGLAYAVAIAFVALKLAYEVSQLWFLAALFFLAVALTAKRDRALQILLPRGGKEACREAEDPSGPGG